MRSTGESVTAPCAVRSESLTGGAARYRSGACRQSPTREAGGGSR
jgi:hypothetical protein